jgi:threonine synthase
MQSASTRWQSPSVSLFPPDLDSVGVTAKLELYGPTGSHKDRECALILPVAIRQGHVSVGCSSTGNLATALAHACRSAELGCEVWLAATTAGAHAELLREMGARVHVVDGDYSNAVRVGNQAMTDRGIFNANPSQCEYKISASQALGKEILKETRATHIICATNNGSLAAGLIRAAREAPHDVKLVAATCAKGKRALAIAGAHALEQEWRRERIAPDCRTVDVDDREIEFWESWLESQGLLVQPAAAATLAALARLELRAGDRVVCILSGLRDGTATPVLR